MGDHDAATRLREIVLSAERNQNTPLESSFSLLDPSATGLIPANYFRIGLQRLGTENSSGSKSSFVTINDEDCEELVALFDTNHDGLVSLLEFYRFMGRRSPPPSVVPSEESEREDDNLY